MGWTRIRRQSARQSICRRRTGCSLEKPHQSLSDCFRSERAVSAARTIQVGPNRSEEAPNLLAERLTSTSGCEQLAGIGELHCDSVFARLDNERYQSGCLHSRQL